MQKSSKPNSSRFVKMGGRSNRTYGTVKTISTPKRFLSHTSKLTPTIQSQRIHRSQPLFRSTSPQLASDKFGDTWTRQAKALGYPSRAVFKLIQAQKKFKILQPSDVVVDLGCSPGSWSKLSSTIVTGSGFVLGMDLTTLSPQEQLSIGVRQGDVNQRFEYPKSYHTGSTQQGGLLASERKLLKARAPVGYMQQDVTQWIPGPGFQHQVDVLLSDIAPNTTGITSVDSSNSIDLCYSVIELCSQLFKPPSTKIEQFSGPKERQQALNKLKNDPNHENILVEHLTTQFNKNMEKHYGGDEPKINHSAQFDAGTDERAAGHITSTPSSPSGPTILQHSSNRINLKMIKKTLKQHVYLQKPNAVGIVDTDDASAIYKTNERTLSQIKGNEHISTTWRGTLMMKVFQGEGMTDLMNILKQIFVSTYIFKPDSSRVESVEVFIICKGYCGPFDHTRITNKHIRRPKTEEYLHSYVSNNRKRAPAPHDPTKSRRYHIGFTPDSPISQPIIYDERSAPKRSSTYKMSIADLYAQAQGDNPNAVVSFTSDGFKEQERAQHDQEWHIDQIQRTIASGVTTNVHSAIKNTASLEQGAMSPLQREISESDDMVVFHREQFEKLYDRERVVNQIPDTDALIKSMSIFWEEGINYAKKLAIESQTPSRLDVFASKPTFTDEIRQDEVSSILNDLSSPAPSTVTASSIIQEHFRAKKGKTKKAKNVDVDNSTHTNILSVNNDQDDSIPQNPIKANLLNRTQSKVSLPTSLAKISNVPEATTITTPIKKTRGRPRTTLPPPEPNSQPSSTIIPKKRGRPSTKQNTTTMTTSPPSPSEILIQPKKRGRPAKVITEAPIDIIPEVKPVKKGTTQTKKVPSST